ncbi:MAG: helix-turn-helix domain-containing protein [Gemmatimonadota bacterium]|nr:MAG: helix-turn-helix domain-containing protein [Gemmatimonadota bacterium]
MARRRLRYPSPFVKLGEAATLCGVRADTVRNWTKTKGLTYYQFGRCVRILRVDLLRFLERKEHRGRYAEAARAVRTAERENDPRFMWGRAAVARELGCTITTVRKLQQSGALPAVRHRRGFWRFERTDVERVARENHPNVPTDPRRKEAAYKGHLTARRNAEASLSAIYNRG